MRGSMAEGCIYVTKSSKEKHHDSNPIIMLGQEQAKLANVVSHVDIWPTCEHHKYDQHTKALDLCDKCFQAKFDQVLKFIFPDYSTKCPPAAQSPSTPSAAGRVQPPSPYVLDQIGSHLTSSIMQMVSYDKRDSRIEPTEGYFVRGSTEFAGLGGDTRYVRGGMNGGQYFTLTERVILGISGSGSYIYGLGQRVRITDRMYAGGDSLRGFATGGVSPRDKNTGDAIGGVWLATGSAQVKFPIGLPEEFGVLGEAFTDFGTVGPTDVGDTSAVDQSSSLRAAVGIGVSWKSPMGPVAVDIGIPVMKQSFDKTELFKFNFGSKF